MEFTDVGICACGQPIAVSTKDFAVIHKLPQCEQFKQLEPGTIHVKLETICRGIGISPSPQHLDFIATSAQGNMRTAENTLEQIAVLST